MTGQAVKESTYELVEVEFHGQKIEAVWDGKDVWVVVKRICENLGINHSNQIKKIKANQSYADLQSDITLQHESGAKQTSCLHLEALTLWLASIQPNRVKEEVRDSLIKYQRECMKVLTEHFFGKKGASKKPPSAAQQLLATARVMVEHEERLVQLEQRMDAQEERQRRAARELLALPQPEDIPQARTMRSVLVERVRQVAVIQEQSHRDLWNKLYREYRYRSGIDLKARAKNRNKRPLDIGEELGVVGKLYDLCCFLWPMVMDDLTSDKSNLLEA